MRRRNLREVRRCASGELTRRMLAVTATVAALVLAVPACTVWTGETDVVATELVLKSETETPPDATIIHLMVKVHVYHEPISFYLNAELFRRIGTRWVPSSYRPLYYVKSDLPPVGHSDWLYTPSTPWKCNPGIYYVEFTASGTDHLNKQHVDTLYFPWYGYSRTKPGAGNGGKPPTVKQAWHTNCHGGDSDTIIGYPLGPIHHGGPDLLEQWGA